MSEVGKKVGRGSDQFPLRLPEGMRRQLKTEASRNSRTMNAEIVARLVSSLEEPPLLETIKTAMREVMLEAGQ